MRKRIFALLTAASMFVGATPALVRACDNPPNAQGSYDTGLANRNANAQSVNGRISNNGQASDRVMDSISRVDVDNDRDTSGGAAQGWQRGGNWSTPSTTATALPTRPTY